MNAAFAMLIGLLASLGAGACAYADGALLALDPDYPPADRALAAMLRRRERIHRALAFARVTLQIVAGASCAIAVNAVEGFATIPLLVFVLGGLALVLLSESTARDAGEHAGLGALTAMRPVVEIVERGLIPVVTFGEWIDRGLSTLVPPSPHAEDAAADATVEKFRQVVASEVGATGPRHSILSGVFSLGETTVADVMTPRVDVIGVEHDATWDEVVARVRTSEHSRVIVYEGDLDRITGVLYAKDLLPYVVADTAPAAHWTSLVRPAPVIPTSKRVDTQLREFRDSRRHLAVVVDEFGGTAGIVTIEDILRLIVSDIRDEFDVKEPPIREVGEQRYWVSGRLTLDKVSDVVGDDLRHEDVTTVGGLAYELFGRVPRPGDSTQFRSWKLVVEAVRGRRVERVSLERVNAAIGAEQGA
jgi:CBS domain containing-hemolysin-like protein